MALTVTHAVVATGTNDGTKQVSKDAWNDDHVLTGDYLRKATVTLSSAQILDLHNTPITLVAAPGAGKYLAVDRASGYYTFGTVDYVVTVAPRLAYDGQTAGLIQVGAIAYGQDSIYSVAVSLEDFATVYVNKAVVVMCDGSAITTGDGTLTVTVWYSIEDVP